MPLDKETYVMAIGILSNSYYSLPDVDRQGQFLDRLTNFLGVLGGNRDKDSGLFFAAAKAYEVDQYGREAAVLR
jgi:hypothetical protein